MSYYKKVTLKDIANDSGVSVSSVSMILNKREGVSFSDKTVEKVLSSAKKLGYEIVLVNSNPATIMTDKQIADKCILNR